MKYPLLTLIPFLAFAPAVSADEFTDVVAGALEAYEEGDITVAREELDYAMKLLSDLKAQSLAGFLPEAMPGWTRTEADAEGGGMAMAMLGGGTTAAATYTDGSQDLTITLMANSPMVSGVAAMITGMAAMGGGKPIRIQRTQFGVNGEEMQGVVDGDVLVSVSGDASIEDKTAYIEAMDLKALGDF
jgi:hypothetical protein